MIPVTKSFLPPIEEYIEYLRKIWDTNQLTNNGSLVKELEQKLKCCESVEVLAEFIHDQFFPINVEGAEPNWAKFRALANELWEQTKAV